MEIVLVRDTSPKGDVLLGELFIGGRKYCDTCEDLPRPVKIPGETCIPRGRYELVVKHFGPPFNKERPMLLNVPGFTGILIHAGSNATHTRGCILVGKANLNRSGLEASTSLRISISLTEVISDFLKAGKVYLTVTSSEILG